METLLKLCLFGVISVLAASAYALEPRPTHPPVERTMFKVKSMAVPEFLAAFFSDYLKAPYEIDPSVTQAHGGDRISLSIDEPVSRDEVYSRVSTILRDHYGVTVTYADNIYRARMAE